jgi:hypothetical protein
MGSTYHFSFKAPATTTALELEAFLRGVEVEAKRLGFRPTHVINGLFDTTEQKQFSRRLTTGFPVEDARLKGADVPDDSRVWHFDSSGGTCRVPPSAGVLMVVTNECGQEAIFGLMKFPDRIKDTSGAVVAETRLEGGWWFHDHMKSPDPRYREIVRRFRDAGFLAEELDEFE